MGFFASVNGLQVVSGSLMIPNMGAWTADLDLATSQQPSGPATVVVGNLTLQGFIFRSEAYGGQVAVRLVGGYGGWRKTVPRQGYGSNSGVLLSHVLNDVAVACGEQVNVAIDSPIGNAYTRLEGPASDVLWQLMVQGLIPAWHVAPSGVTQITPWPMVTVNTAFTITDQKPDEGLIVIATEDYAAFLPGASFTAPQIEGTYSCAGLNYQFHNDGQFRLEVLTGTTDRLLGPLTAFVKKQVAHTRFYGRYAYVLSNPSTSTVDATPQDKTLGLPDLKDLPLDADSISTYTPPDGGICHVQFVDGKATQPVCVWTAGQPTMAALLGGSNPVARLGDQVQVFLPPTLPLSGTVSGNPFVGVATIVNPLSGAITQGSSTVSTQ